MTIRQHKTISLHDEDRHLVDLLATVLVDPSIHTDTRLHLYHQIDETLRDAHEDLHGPAGADVHRQALRAHDQRLPDVLTSLLVDPNLHTDTRMRLHHEIAAILASARGRDRR
jgi:hypothetical protein